MAETPEGISSRKWSLGRGNDGEVLLMEGKTILAILTPDGVKLVPLIVSALQLWTEVNDFLVKSEGPGRILPNFLLRLSNIIAKAANKSTWQEVIQS